MNEVIFISPWSLFLIMFGLTVISGAITWLVMSGIFCNRIDRLEKDLERFPEEEDDVDRSS